MRMSNTKKEIENLIGMIVALSRFILKAANRSLPFFRLLKKAIEFEWMSECEQALT